jgi:hypothetical protein
LGKQSLEKKSRKNSMCHSLSLSSLDVKSWTWLYKMIIEGRKGRGVASNGVFIVSAHAAVPPAQQCPGSWVVPGLHRNAREL